MLRGFLPVCLGIQKDGMGANLSQKPEAVGIVSAGAGVAPDHTQSANNGAPANLPAAVNFRQYPIRVVSPALKTESGGLDIQALTP
jgi:hypothetical protein